MTECSCFRCTKELCEREPLAEDQLLLGVVDPRMNRMFLCSECGNKRCPHAADHRNLCTRSNAPGQPGSLYADQSIGRQSDDAAQVTTAAPGRPENA